MVELSLHAAEGLQVEDRVCAGEDLAAHQALDTGIRLKGGTKAVLEQEEINHLDMPPTTGQRSLMPLWNAGRGVACVLGGSIIFSCANIVKHIRVCRK